MTGVLSLNPPYYEALKRLTLELAGVNLGSDHAFLVETRLSALARKEGFDSLDALVNELFGSGDSRLAVQVVSTLLERDSHFNKDPKSFAYFSEKILPELYAVRGGGQVRLLSFGCAAGQEAYGMAMAFDRIKGDFPGLSVEIIGVDYPSAALDRAKAGRYTHFEVQRGLAARDLIKYFEPAPEPNSSDWIVGQSLKNLVTFRDVHLLSSLGSLPKFHGVLFRGSLPHYSGPAKLRVLRGLSSLVLPYGYLLLGHNESLKQINFGFDPVDGADCLYRKREEIAEDMDPLDDAPKIKSNGRTTFLKTQKKKTG